MQIESQVLKCSSSTTTKINAAPIMKIMNSIHGKYHSVFNVLFLRLVK